MELCRYSEITSCISYFVHIPKSPVEADCTQPEGCLFCNNYAVHADEIDIRKLCSLDYVIRATKSLAASEEHFNKIFGTVILRIENILKAVSLKSKELANLVLSIQKDVYDNENLDSYWEEKLSLLIKIGAI